MEEMSRWKSESGLVMILLIDVGNSNTHLGLANSRRVIKKTDSPTSGWLKGKAPFQLAKFVGGTVLEGAALCSVVPRATPAVRRVLRDLWRLPCLELSPKTLRGVGIEYPKPATIGPDRLANAVAAHHHFGAPVLAVDFGTALTFDIVNRGGKYIGGIIAPGLAAMTDYLHEKTALLPRIKIRETRSIIGKSTQEAMLIGAVHGYRGLIRELLMELKGKLRAPSLPVVATGGYARLMAAQLPEITHVEPNLTLEGLRLVWQANGRR